MEEKKKITQLSELGEFGLISHLTGKFKTMKPSTVKGIGDDAAVLDHKGKRLVVTTDLLMEGIHFNLVYTPLKHLGYKAVVVNLSDVCAMNAIPQQITVSIAVSARYSVEALEILYQGIATACEKYEVDLIGGDTSASLTGMAISVTAIGVVEKAKTVFRNTAVINDLICVSGDLGAAYTGLQLLERENKIFRESGEKIQPELHGYEYILQRQLKPEARVDIISELNRVGIVPSSMIDLSDGLSSDLLHICKQSGVGCKIYQEKIPIAEETAEAAREMNLEPFICALNGGEDYELLFTVPVDKYEIISTLTGISVIGHITKEGHFFITPEGNEIELKAQGWDAAKA